jgi:hypothetical protein
MIAIELTESQKAVAVILNEDRIVSTSFHPLINYWPKEK